MTMSVESTNSTLPGEPEFPKRDHSNGQTMAEKTPANAAVMGVGAIFTWGVARLNVGQLECEKHCRPRTEPTNARRTLANFATCH